MQNFNAVLRKAGVVDLIRFVQFPVFEEDDGVKSQLIRLENLHEVTRYHIDIRSITDYLLLMARESMAKVNGKQGMLKLNVTE